MPQPTAVDWLIKYMMLNGMISLTEDNYTTFREITREAKRMEKEHIIDAFDTGCADENIIGVEYYNGTYGEDK